MEEPGLRWGGYVDEYVTFDMYTTDGNDSNENSVLWKEPMKCDASLIKAKAFVWGKKV